MFSFLTCTAVFIGIPILLQTFSPIIGEFSSENYLRISVDMVISFSLITFSAFELCKLSTKTMLINPLAIGGTVSIFSYFLFGIDTVQTLILATLNIPFAIVGTFVFWKFNNSYSGPASPQSIKSTPVSSGHE